MSLLSQFYPSGSGGPYPFPNPAVPPMTLGGHTSSLQSRIYTIGGSVGFGPLGGISPELLNTGIAGEGWLSFAGESRYFTRLIQYGVGGLSPSNFTPILLEAKGPISLLGLLQAGGGDLVFENVSVSPGPITLTITAGCSSIYGLKALSALTVGGSSLQNWFFGDVISGSLTITAPSLANVETSRFLVDGSGDMDFSGTSLNQASVDKILVDNDDFITTGTGTIDLGGGCAEPGPAGLAAAASLQAKGLTIITN